MDITLIWAGIIATAVLLYVVLDGFDLGVGILFPFATPKERDTMSASIAPVWDGNETWLVLGGGGLLAAFPLAYSILMPALYLPIGFMLTALIFRGVAFEFRVRAGPSGHGKRFWTAAFSGGSMAAAISQGFVLGGFIQGVKVTGRSFAGGAFDWLNAYTLLVAAGLVAGYALLGACWLVFKTEGELQAKARRWALRLFIGVAAGMAAVSLVTLFIDPRVTVRWGVTLQSVEWNKLLPLTPVPLAAAACIALGWKAAQSKAHLAPYLYAVGAFVMGFAGLAISLFPNVVPFDITIWEAAAGPKAQGFMLVGVSIMLPVILAYTGFVYWLFRAKVSEDAAYH